MKKPTSGSITRLLNRNKEPEVPTKEAKIAFWERISGPLVSLITKDNLEASIINKES